MICSLLVVAGKAKTPKDKLATISLSKTKMTIPTSLPQKLSLLTNATLTITMAWVASRQWPLRHSPVNTTTSSEWPLNRPHPCTPPLTRKCSLEEVQAILISTLTLKTLLSRLITFKFPNLDGADLKLII